MKLRPAGEAEEYAEKLFREVPDEDFKLAVSEHLEGLGYIQVNNSNAYLAFRNDELNLDIKVIRQNQYSFKIFLKSTRDWFFADIVRKTGLVEAISNHGIIEFKDAMRRSWRQLLSQHSL